MGQLETLQYAYEHGCPWDREMTDWFDGPNGHLHVLQWAAYWEVDLDETTVQIAQAGGHPHILEWARENGLIPEP